MASIAQVIANVNRGKNQSAFKVSDFIINYEKSYDEAIYMAKHNMNAEQYALQMKIDGLMFSLGGKRKKQDG